MQHIISDLLIKKYQNNDKNLLTYSKADDRLIKKNNLSDLHIKFSMFLIIKFTNQMFNMTAYYLFLH